MAAAALDLELNPGARRVLRRQPSEEPRVFHRTLPGWASTPLHDAPALAAGLGLRRLWLKDESERMGLPAFKIAGAAWGVAVALAARLGTRPDPAAGLEGLRRFLAGAPPLTLVAATDGNHGRAVARMARLLGLPARILVPEDMACARREQIASEGAAVEVVPGGYDAAVACTAAVDAGDPGAVVVSDTAWPGYTDVPEAVIDGYASVLWEIEEALAARGEAGPDVVVVQVGVGAFAAAVTRHWRRPGLAAPPAIVSVEPTRAAGALASLRAGHPVVLEGVQDSIMSGLNCATPSPVAWPELVAGIDLFAAIDDDLAREGMRDLAGAGLVGGECSGGGLGAARAVLAAPGVRAALGLPEAPAALVFLTEGATDPAAYEAIVGRPPALIAAGASPGRGSARAAGPPA